VTAHGSPRLTADVDVTLFVSTELLAPLMRSLTRSGFLSRVDDPVDFAERARVVPFVHRPTGLLLDLVLGGEGTEALFLERATILDLGGVRVPVIALEDLVVTKIVAGRPRDLEDVRSLLKHSPDLDHVRRTLAIFEEDLERTDLTRTLDDLVSKSRR
jgi:hypothetical protein